MNCQNCGEPGDPGKSCSTCGFILGISALPIKEEVRRIKVEPMDPEHRAAMIRLVKEEHEPIKSNAICGPGPRPSKK